MTKISIKSDTKYTVQRMLSRSIRLNAFSFILGSTGLVVEHARWKKVLARYIGLRFHAATKALVVAQELAKAKRFNYGKKLNSVLV